jgi:hypothetical protein
MAVCGHLAMNSQDTISKITREKWTGSVAQGVECLLCKCEALSSNASPTKKKKEDEAKKGWMHTPINIVRQ